MPVVPRPSQKASKIAFKIIGIPPNLKKQKVSKEEKYINKRLLYEETFRVR